VRRGVGFSSSVGQSNSRQNKLTRILVSTAAGLASHSHDDSSYKAPATLLKGSEPGISMPKQVGMYPGIWAMPENPGDIPSMFEVLGRTSCVDLKAASNGI